MTTRGHRPQKAEEIANEDTRQLDVTPLENIEDRINNPKDIEVDTAAIANGIDHGGMTQNRAESAAARGSGGRKRAGGYGRSNATSKKR